MSGSTTGTPVTPIYSGTGETLSSLIAAIQDILQDSAYTTTKIAELINDAVNSIAAGIRMPNGQISPPLPDLFAQTTVTTSTTLPYVSLPVNYQRKVMNIYDSSGCRIAPPSGGDYYAFALFLKRVNNFNLTEAGSVYRVCVKGSKLYYQGIPSAATTLGVHYYKKPTPMVTATDEPDGIPEHLQLRLIKHHVCKEIFGEAIEDGQDNAGIGTKYHTAKFFEAMTDLVDFIGIDATPTYYGGDDFEDAGACD